MHALRGSLLKRQSLTWSAKRILHATQSTSLRNRKPKKPISDVARTNEISIKSLLDNAVSAEAETYDHRDVWHTDPYNPMKKKIREQDQAKLAYRPNVDPGKTSIILFPGQGTQYIGMCKQYLEYPNVKEMYALASEILEYDMLKLSLEGPQEELDRTKYQQPAIFLASLASIEKLRALRPEAIEACVGAAGFSLGEITALTFAEAFTFEEALRLIAIRAELMQIASDEIPSGMAAVHYRADSRLGFALEVARKICAQRGMREVDCRVANYLFPGCKVVAGNMEALQFIMENKNDFKLKKVQRLNVSGAFHTNLMKGAGHTFSMALKDVNVQMPLIPVYSNFDYHHYTNVNQVYRKLPKQIYSPVKWEQIMHVIYSRDPKMGFPVTYECGPRSSLKAILKKVNIKAWDQTFSIEELVE